MDGEKELHGAAKKSVASAARVRRALCDQTMTDRSAFKVPSKPTARLEPRFLRFVPRFRVGAIFQITQDQIEAEALPFSVASYSFSEVLTVWERELPWPHPPFEPFQSRISVFDFDFHAAKVSR